MYEEAGRVHWRRARSIVQIRVEMKRVHEFIAQNDVAGVMPIERRLQLLPHLALDFRRRALLGWLTHVSAGRIPVRDVHRKNAAHRSVAVPVAEHSAISP